MKLKLFVISSCHASGSFILFIEASQCIVIDGREQSVGFSPRRLTRGTLSIPYLAARFLVLSMAPQPRIRNLIFFFFFLPHLSLVQVELGRKQEVVVYDQNSKEAGQLSKDGFVHILMGKLESTFHKVSLLTGNQSALSFFFFCSLLICAQWSDVHFLPRSPSDI